MIMIMNMIIIMMMMMMMMIIIIIFGENMSLWGNSFVRWKHCVCRLLRVRNSRVQLYRKL